MRNKILFRIQNLYPDYVEKDQQGHLHLWRLNFKVKCPPLICTESLDFLFTFNLCAVSGGFMISAFTYDMNVLYLTFGVMCGTAQSFLYVGGASILYHYFDEKKGLATSRFSSLIFLCSQFQCRLSCVVSTLGLCCT